MGGEEQNRCSTRAALMVRAVLDTTTLATFTTAGEKSLMRILAHRWLIEEAFQAVISAYIYAELEGVLHKKYFQSRLTHEQIIAYLQTVKESSTLVTLYSSIRGVAPHAKDDPVIATAIDGNAQYIVTGDKAFERIRLIQSGIRIMSPVDFLHELDKTNRLRQEQAA